MAARRAKSTLDEPEAILRATALGYPEVTEEFPWGERALKVRKKIFFFLSRHAGGLKITAKLPESRHEALVLPFAEPTHYGMGKHGWVTFTFDEGDEVPVDWFVDWMDESFRAVAPKAVVEALAAKKPTAEKATAEKAAAKKAAAKKPAAKKAAAPPRRPRAR